MADVEHMNINGGIYDISDAIARQNDISLGNEINKVKNACESEISKINDKLDVLPLIYENNTYGYRYGNLVNLSFRYIRKVYVVAALKAFDLFPSLSSRFLIGIDNYLGYLDFFEDASDKVIDFHVWETYGGEDRKIFDNEDPLIKMTITYLCELKD